MSEQNPLSDCRLYLISPATIDDPESFVATLSQALQGGDVASFQLRLKDADENHIIKCAETLIPVCHSFDVIFIINDSAEIAAKVNADGVHLGQSDGEVKAARDILGHNKVIGVTCHNSRHLAFEAGDKGADYVAFGAFYPTTTKDVLHQAELETLVWWSDLAEIPSVAIGGITVENCTAVADAGADFIAVCSGVWDYAQGPQEAVKQFNEKLSQ